MLKISDRFTTVALHGEMDLSWAMVWYVGREPSGEASAGAVVAEVVAAVASLVTGAFSGDARRVPGLAAQLARVRETRREIKDAGLVEGRREIFIGNWTICRT
jgi:hypothetical protein